MLVIAAFCADATGQSSTPSWLHDARGFCQELAKRTNGARDTVPFGKPARAQLFNYPARPVARQRTEEGILGKYDWEDPKVFSASVKAEIKKGPDFAGRFAILRWSCGSGCSNATIADVITGKTYETPFVGIVGCAVTGDSDTLQRKADSSLLIARGRLEMAFGDHFDEGPCGSYYFQWRSNHLRLIGCDIDNLERR
jgi:hypothetical protein